MTFDSVQKQPRTVEIDKLIRPQSRVDLILNQDLMTGQSDVRSSMILDVTPEAIVIAQCDPPLLRSMVGREIEATIVHHDLVTYETSRWGWQTRILGINNEYKLNARNGGAVAASVAFLVLPGRGGLTKTNVRQGYRIDVADRDDIKLYLAPDMAPVQLLDFSSIGVMLATSMPTAFEIGQAFHLTMIFPEDEQMSEVTIDAEVDIVRFEYEPGDKTAKMGLKYQKMDMAASRTLYKIINYYMLDEQKRRNRGA